MINRGNQQKIMEFTTRRVNQRQKKSVGNEFRIMNLRSGHRDLLSDASYAASILVKIISKTNLMSIFQTLRKNIHFRVDMRQEIYNDYIVAVWFGGNDENRPEASAD